jgi:hypothetical protein
MSETQEELMNVGLPKWPEMRVTGESVTPQQAKEIILRTDGHMESMWSNNEKFDKQIHEMFGIPYDGHLQEIPYPQHPSIRNPMYKADEQLQKDLRMIEDLEYLNNSRISNCYLGGYGHGWCDWDGTIRHSDHNIGKWPCVDEVYKEWSSIAKAFPFLNLTCQLMSDEEIVDRTYPVINFIVKDGKVTLEKPTEMLKVPRCSNEDKRFQNIDQIREIYNEVYDNNIPKWKCKEYDVWLDKLYDLLETV